MKFHVSWVQARADTKIGYGDRPYRENNATTTWIVKKGWYHIPDDNGEVVTKMQFMTIINDLQRLMIRAKFHTDQIEGV